MYILTLCLFAPLSHAVDVNCVANGIWTNSTTWSDANVPTAGNDYFVTGYTITSPTPPASVYGNNTYTFAGDRLTVYDGGNLRFYRETYWTDLNSTFVIDNLTISNAQIECDANYGTMLYHTTKLVTFSGSTNTIRLDQGGYRLLLYFPGGIAGTSDINVLHVQNTGGRQVVLNGSTSAFLGDWYADSTATALWNRYVWISARNTNGWGTGTLNLQKARLVMDTVDVDSPGSITMTGDSSIDLGGGVALNHTVEYLRFQSTSVPEGTYTAAELNTSFSNGSTNFYGTGTLTIRKAVIQPFTIGNIKKKSPSRRTAILTGAGDPLGMLRVSTFPGLKALL